MFRFLLSSFLFRCSCVCFHLFSCRTLPATLAFMPIVIRILLSSFLFMCSCAWLHLFSYHTLPAAQFHAYRNPTSSTQYTILSTGKQQHASLVNLQMTQIAYWPVDLKDGLQLFLAFYPFLAYQRFLSYASTIASLPNHFFYKWRFPGHCQTCPMFSLV